MKHGVTRLIDPTISHPEDARPRANWYTQGRSDGFGDRILMFDNSSAAPLELLRFTEEWSRAAGFQTALAERVAALRRFSHVAVSDVRGVRSLDGGRVALVSAQVSGRLLSEILGEGGGPELALELIRQLAPALAALGTATGGTAHGALTPERIVLTADGRFVMTEHPLGIAIDALTLPSARMAGELGILSRDAWNEPLSDDVKDVAQLGYVALEVLLGRPLDPNEYATEGRALLARAQASSGRGSAASAQVQSWLERAWPGAPDGFRTIRDASGFLGPRPAIPVRNLGPAPAIPRATSAEAETRRSGHEQGLPSELDVRERAPRMHPIDVVDIPRTRDRDVENDPARRVSPRPEPVAAPVLFRMPSPSAATPARPAATSLVEDLLDVPFPVQPFPVPIEERPSAGNVPAAPELPDAAPGWLAGYRFERIHGIAAGLAALVLIQSVVIVVLLRRPAVSTPSPQPPTALAAELLPETRAAAQAPAVARSQSNDARSSAAKASASSSAAPAWSMPKDAVPAPPVTGPVGTLRIGSPMPLHVLEGQFVIGTTDNLLTLSPGPHVLDLVNQALDYHARRLVDIVKDETTGLQIVVLPGHVSLQADEPDVAVSIDGKPAGVAPLLDVPLPVGVHTIVARHATLGERRQEIVVKAESETVVTLNFRR